MLIRPTLYVTAKPINESNITQFSVIGSI